MHDDDFIPGTNLNRGAYPEMYSTERDWEDFYKSYVNTYIERDVNELIATDSVTFSKFMTVLAARTGQLLIPLYHFIPGTV